MSADARVVIHLLTLKCGPPLDKEPSREEIKLAERMACILKDFKARQLEADEDEQLEVVKKQEEGWDSQDELIDVERQASSGHMTSFSGGNLVSEEKVRLQVDFVYGADVISPCMEANREEPVALEPSTLCLCITVVKRLYIIMLISLLIDS
ncbi:unnamed protein product [Heligmosomoides polygyrus]|uniref:Protein kinase domain-containing protein n=1 Tax=Heligmosomoides polygyrus TaxID=6339 RepID=A0A183FB21_HELPZ|nr:unnamed protein product [Heligmosomoides polygyrus]